MSLDMYEAAIAAELIDRLHNAVLELAKEIDHDRYGEGSMDITNRIQAILDGGN